MENLNERGIIGADVLNQYNAQINFNNQTIKWNIEGTIHTTSFARTKPKNTAEDVQVHKIRITNWNKEGDQNISEQQNE